jgi:hypothetical protein
MPRPSSETRPPDEVEHALRRRGADLCRQDPARFVEMVQYADQLRAGGVEYLEASAMATENFTR